MHKFFVIILTVFTIHVNGQSPFVVDQNASSIRWEGNYIIGGGHDGTVKIKSGELSLEGTSIKSAELIIDMNSIRNSDNKSTEDDDLDKHLKSPDFFAADQYSLAYFTFVSAKPPNPRAADGSLYVTGILTIKGISNTIHFPAKVSIEKLPAGKEAVNVSCEFTIDRTAWDITYQSLSYFANLKDGAISNDIKITVNLKFKNGC